MDQSSSRTGERSNRLSEAPLQKEERAPESKPPGGRGDECPSDEATAKAARYGHQAAEVAQRANVGLLHKKM